MDKWLEVSLTVNGELAEAVADVLARFAPNGVVTESDVAFLSDEDEGTATGDVTVRAYLPVDEKLEERRQKVEEALHYLGMIQALPAPVYRPIADQNWMEAWKKHYKPIPIGKRLIIVPAWMESPDAKRIAIRIDPGMAFGTGTHPTTQLCLELLESLFEQHPAVRNQSPVVMDIGCGSGILSIAALKLGAALALGVDIDEAAIKASRANADANQVPVERLLLGLGSVAEVLAGQFVLPVNQQGLHQAPLVMANILAPIIIRLFGMGLAKLVAPGGVLVLSGILAEQADGVQSAAQAQGLELLEKRQMGDWVAMDVG
jgi:ribosomal protein L11 methyltransferase